MCISAGYLVKIVTAYHTVGKFGEFGKSSMIRGKRIDYMQKATI